MSAPKNTEIDSVTTQYIVLNENTLGYITDLQPTLMGVLAGKPQHGGHDPKNGPVPIGPTDDVRAANIADFDHFRVEVPCLLMGKVKQEPTTG